MNERDWAAEAREHLARAAEPLRGQLEEVESEISGHMEVLKGLVETRRFLKSQINRLVPPSAPKPKPSTGNRERAERQFDAKLVGVKAFLADNRLFADDGFTANLLSDTLREQQNDHYPKISTHMAGRIIEALRDQGYLRADRKVRGGGMQFKVVR